MLYIVTSNDEVLFWCHNTSSVKQALEHYSKLQGKELVIYVKCKKDDTQARPARWDAKAMRWVLGVGNTFVKPIVRESLYETFDFMQGVW